MPKTQREPRSNHRHDPTSRRSRQNNNNNDGDDTSPTETFDAMNLKPALLRGIYAHGFERPSAIQQRAIKPILRGRDVIAQSQSGTGKTAVFSVSALQILDEKMKDVQVVVLSPTRELAEQTQRVIQSLGDYMNVKAHACIGGTAQRVQASGQITSKPGHACMMPRVADHGCAPFVFKPYNYNRGSLYM